MLAIVELPLRFKKINSKLLFVRHTLQLLYFFFKTIQMTKNSFESEISRNWILQLSNKLFKHQRFTTKNQQFFIKNSQPIPLWVIRTKYNRYDIYIYLKRNIILYCNNN